MNKVFPILAISTFSSVLGVGIIAPLLPLYADSLGASGLWLGIIFAGFSISRALFMPLFGKISDRRGRRRFICSGLLVYTIISLGYLWANTIGELTLIRFLHGFASAMIVPIAQAYVGDMSPGGSEGKWMGYFNSSFFTGFAMGPLLGGLLTDAFSMDAAFLAMGGLNAVAFLLAFLLLPESKTDRSSPRQASPSLVTVMQSDVMKGLFSYRLVYAIGRSAFMCFLPLYCASSMGLTPGQTAILLSTYMLLVSTSQVFAGRIADSFNRRHLVVVGSLISISFLALVPSMPSFWALLGLAFFGALGGTLSLPASSAMTVAEGRTYGMGSALGLFNMAMSAGMAIGPLLGGLVVDQWDMVSAFYFSAGMGMLGTVAFFYFTKSAVKPDQAAPLAPLRDGMDQP